MKIGDFGLDVPFWVGVVCPQRWGSRIYNCMPASILANRAKLLCPDLDHSLDFEDSQTGFDLPLDPDGIMYSSFDFSNLKAGARM